VKKSTNKKKVKESIYAPLNDPEDPK